MSARSRPWAPPVGRLAGLVMLVAGCGAGPPAPPNGSPGFPSQGTVEVRQATEDTPLTFVWDRLDVVVLDVREVDSGRVVWRIEGAVTPNGPRFIPLPLPYGAPALPPGIHPPDGPSFHTTISPEPLRSGRGYVVRIQWPDGREATAAFTGPSE